MRMTMPNNSSQTTIRCPSCGKRGAWFAAPHGPFCSRRCKLVDLGKWLGEEHAISEPLGPGHFESYGDLPEGARLDSPGPDPMAPRPGPGDQ